MSPFPGQRVFEPPEPGDTARTVRSKRRGGIGANDASGSNGKLPAPPFTSNPRARSRFTQSGSSCGCSACGITMHLAWDGSVAGLSNFVASRRVVKDVGGAAHNANRAISSAYCATAVTCRRALSASTFRCRGRRRRDADLSRPRARRRRTSTSATAFSAPCRSGARGFRQRC
jgi:hypothetical protein